MNIWKYLGIEPTTDIAQIRSAYARQAKTCHPEEHPAEFKMLQRAYKTALQYAKYKKKAQTAQPRIQQKTSGCPQEPAEPYAGAEAPPVSYDYSKIDTYGDRERFFRKFHLIVYNPYLINHVTAWQIFLHDSAFTVLFRDDDFRAAFVKEICSLYGFSREALLYFDRFLKQFQKPEQQPKGGVWETEDPVFRRRKRRHIRLSFFSGNGFRNKEGKAFHETILASFSRVGRTIDLNRRKDVEDYIRSYLMFAGPKDEKLARFYRKRKYLDLKLLASCSAVTIAMLLLLFLAEREEEREKAEERELFRQEVLTQQESAYRRSFMKQEAEEEIDRLLETYRAWKADFGE